MKKYTVKKTGKLAPTTKYPKAKEFAVIVNKKIIGYVAANTKKFAEELALDMVDWYTVE